MNATELRNWAEAHASGPSYLPQAVAVLAMLTQLDELTRLIEALADRVHRQSELLGKKTEKITP